MPSMVGMRGSSQPLTLLSVTSAFSLRLEVSAYSSSRRENSYWRGWQPMLMLSSTQSYSGRWSSNSSVHSEWVMPSIASEMQWV
ncbi:hypothetical protein D3C72_2210290 [compost metagenome]